MQILVFVHASIRCSLRRITQRDPALRVFAPSWFLLLYNIAHLSAFYASIRCSLGRITLRGPALRVFAPSRFLLLYNIAHLSAFHASIRCSLGRITQRDLALCVFAPSRFPQHRNFTTSPSLNFAPSSHFTSIFNITLKFLPGMARHKTD